MAPSPVSAPAVFRRYAFPLGWVAFSGLMLVDIIWHAFSRVTLPLGLAGTAVLLLGPHLLLFCVRFVVRHISRDSGRNLPMGRIMLAAEHIVLTQGFGSGLLCLIYLLATLNFPLVDAPLAAADLALGFDWRLWVGFSQEHGFLTGILRFAYNTFFLQMFLFSIVFGWKNDKARLYEYIWLLAGSLLLTALIFAFFPATGPAPFYDMAEMYKTIGPALHESFAHLQALRAGTPMNFEEALTGIISFPSFHSAAAVVLAYAFRGTGWLGRSLVAVNLLMIAATPFQGAHYLVDTLAGIALAAALIGVRKTVFRSY